LVIIKYLILIIRSALFS